MVVAHPVARANPIPLHNRKGRISLDARGRSWLPNTGFALKHTNAFNGRTTRQKESAGRSDVLTKQAQIVGNIQFNNPHARGIIAQRFKHCDREELYSEAISSDSQVYSPLKGEPLIFQRTPLETRNIQYPGITCDARPFTSVNGLPKKGQYFVQGLCLYAPDISKEHLPTLGTGVFAGNETIENTSAENRCRCRCRYRCR
jgi:hypothetical protein